MTVTTADLVSTETVTYINTPCPDFCTLPVLHPVDSDDAAGGVRVHSGPGFGLHISSWAEEHTTAPGVLKVGVDLYGSDNGVTLDVAGLRQHAQDALAAADWLEGQQGAVDPADALVGAVAGAEDAARAAHDDGACHDSEFSCSHCEAERTPESQRADMKVVLNVYEALVAAEMQVPKLAEKTGIPLPLLESRLAYRTSFLMSELWSVGSALGKLPSQLLAGL